MSAPTGKQLYDALAQEWFEALKRRPSAYNYGPAPTPPVLLTNEFLAWPFLSDQEKRAFTNAAARFDLPELKSLAPNTDTKLPSD